MELPLPEGEGEVMHPALASLPALPALFWAAGVFLRRTDALSPEDGLAAHRLLLTVLVPIVAIGLGVGARCWFLEPASRNLAALGLGHVSALYLASRVAHRNLPARDRGTATALVTCVSAFFAGVLCQGVGASLTTARAAAVADLPASVSSFILAALVLVRTRGRLLGGAMPGRYRHSDGGVYSGEWKGFSKHGSGVYTYPSGSVYSGDWSDNGKDGCGTYRYGNGGAYIGEWRKGNPWGLGIRVYKSGRSEHGNFVDGKIESVLPADVCEATVSRALRAARKAEAIARERNQPLYARLFAQVSDVLPLLFVLLAPRLPAAVSAMASEDVARSTLVFLPPLAALATGLQSAFGPGRSDSTLLDVSGVVCFRYGVSCLVAAAALAAGPVAIAGLGDRHLVLGCLLCPVSPLVALLTGRFTREAQKFVGAVVGWSVVLSLGLTAGCEVACRAGGLLAGSAFASASSLTLLGVYAANERKKRPKISPAVACLVEGAPARRSRGTGSAVRGQPVTRSVSSAGRWSTRALARRWQQQSRGHGLRQKTRGIRPTTMAAAGRVLRTAF